MAPAAVPSSIEQEKDPVKRAKLIRMHRVATARIRVSVLKRRQRLLSNTINRLKKDEKSADRVKKLQREMRSLDASLREADQELQQAQDEVEVSR